MTGRGQKEENEYELRDGRGEQKSRRKIEWLCHSTFVLERILQGGVPSMDQFEILQQRGMQRQVSLNAQCSLTRGKHVFPRSVCKLGIICELS